LRRQNPAPGRPFLLGIGVGDLVQSLERTYYDGGGRPVETAGIVVPDACWEVAYEFNVDPPADESL
jgi:GntR family transcriptional regulator